MLCQVVFDEDPGASDLGAGDLSGLRARSQFLRMTAQKCSGFMEIQCLHLVLANARVGALTVGIARCTEVTCNARNVAALSRRNEPIEAQHSECCVSHSAIAGPPTGDLRTSALNPLSLAMNVANMWGTSIVVSTGP